MRNALQQRVEGGLVGGGVAEHDEGVELRARRLEAPLPAVVPVGELVGVAGIAARESGSHDDCADTEFEVFARGVDEPLVLGVAQMQEEEGLSRSLGSCVSAPIAAAL